MNIFNGALDSVGPITKKYIECMAHCTNEYNWPCHIVLVHYPDLSLAHYIDDYDLRIVLVHVTYLCWARDPILYHDRIDSLSEVQRISCRKYFSEAQLSYMSILVPSKRTEISHLPGSLTIC